MIEADARARHELHRKLEQVLGEDHAMTLMRQLPQGPAASREDVESAERRLDARIDGVEQRLNAKIDHVDRELSLRLEATEHRLIGAIHEAVGALRGEMARQVRTYTFATIGALLTLAVIAFGAAGLI